VSVLTQADDLRIALAEAADLFSTGRFDTVADVNGEADAALRVTKVADQFVAWLRRPVKLLIGDWGIREMDSGTVTTEPVGGSTMSITLDSSQEGFAPIEARDDRGWVTKTALDVTVTPAEGSTGEVVSVEIVATPAGSPDQLVVRAVSEGSALVTVSVPDNDTIADASESFDLVPGGTASITFGSGFEVREQTAGETPPVV